MKKSLLAIALITGFTGTAQAESTVTLYGLADAGYGYTSQKTTFTNAAGTSSYKSREIGARSGVSNTSRWGLKGSEDFGHGTSAIFLLENGFNIGNGQQEASGVMFDRQAYVGLSGESWGTFTIGRQYNAADAFIAGIDPFEASWGQAGVNNTFGDSVSATYDNAIKYVSPDYSGFQFGIGAFHENNKIASHTGTINKDARAKSTGVTVGVGYNNGPLSIGASLDVAKTKKTTYTNGILDQGSYVNAKAKAWNLGAAYDFDMIKVHALVGQQRDGAVGGIGLASRIVTNFTTGDAFDSTWNSKGLRQTSWMLGLSAPVSEAGNVLFSYQGNTIKNKLVDDDGRIKSHIFSLGYKHELSKRTAVYGLASYGSAKLDYAAPDEQYKLKSTDVAVGLEHRF